MTATSTAPPAPVAATETLEKRSTETIPLSERRGRPLHLAWTWSSPNLEFATVFVGVLATMAFGLTFWQAAAAILLGNGLAALSHGILSARGPKVGVPQMVLARVAFGFRGNVVPATLMSVMAGFGWFAVNSVSAAFALSALTTLAPVVCLLAVVLVQIGVAALGHDLVHLFERYAVIVLAVVFAVVAVLTFAKADYSVVPEQPAGMGGFILAAATAWGYSAGWNPYATDYTRYLPLGTGRAAGWAAGVGLFLSTTVLMLAGAASFFIPGATSDNPTEAFTSHLPGALAQVTLLAIALGAICANIINVYSGSMAFLSMGFTSLARRRAVVPVAFGVVGFFLAWGGLADAGHAYESFLLVISYWVAPWLAVVLADQWVRRGEDVSGVLHEKSWTNVGGLVAFIVGTVVSIALFANQAVYAGPVATALPQLGDLTPLVGFVVAGALYLLIPRRSLQTV
ncbi:Purine-cytosine permease [Quadrisphaera granulorum]|uniref:Purine-cytosine permease-like protein n=1 Tax=Quadrisphaera granulorum TaxID=317664 RepID=A0A316A9Q8_9ACTN|nr:cytosine permease [Quadrisphaera granulorum]PWJ53604.1 purine-cytosine permease-like protein [Quadrisphaera granulorum]SZE96648.1 Purine-cytosine permease [Quadrisphaera granulorum]